MSHARAESTLVVVERHAACFYWMDHWGDQPRDGWSMIEHEAWEPDEAFAERLLAVLERGEADADSDHTVVYVAGPFDDPMTVAGRFERVAALLSSLGARHGARLVLTRGHGSATADGDRELSCFAAEIAEEWDTPGVAIGVHPVRLPAAGAVRAA